MSASSSKSDVRTAKSDGVKAGGTGDSTRDKCAELMYDALAFDSGSREFVHASSSRQTSRISRLSGHCVDKEFLASEQILTRAKGIEAAVLNEFGGVTAAYKSKIRSLFVNLKDKNNPGLRESVVAGDIPVQRLCKMSSQVCPTHKTC